MRYRVNRCLLCGQTAIDTNTSGRFVTTSCRTCLAVLTIEFDPPDQPELRARIERLDDADDGGTPLAWMPEAVHVNGEAFARGPDRRTALAGEIESKLIADSQVNRDDELDACAAGTGRCRKPSHKCSNPTARGAAR